MLAVVHVNNRSSCMIRQRACQTEDIHQPKGIFFNDSVKPSFLMKRSLIKKVVPDARREVVACAVNMD